MLEKTKRNEDTFGEIVKEGLRNALKIHIPFILYLAYLVFGVILLGMSIIFTTVPDKWMAYLVLILFIICPGLLVWLLAHLGAKYKYN